MTATLTATERAWLDRLGEIGTWALVDVEAPHQCLPRLAGLGFVQRDPLGGFYWRITDAGRAELRRTAV